MIKKLDINIFIAFVLSFSIFGLLFPYKIPIYSPLVGVLFIYTIIKQKKIVFFTKNLIVLYILELIYFISVFKTGVLYYHVEKDIINIITVNMIIIVLVNNLKDIENFQKFYFYFKKIVFIGTIIIGFIALYKYILLLNGYPYIDFFFSDGEYPWGMALVTDYNFFALGAIIAIIFSYALFKKTNDNTIKFSLVIFTSILISIVFLSGSRRAFLVLTVLLCLFFIVKSIQNVNFLKNNIYFALTSLISFMFIFLILQTNFTSIEGNYNKHEYEKLFERLDTLESSSSRNPRIIRWKFALTSFQKYTFEEKLFGTDFNYLTEYGEKFSNNKVEGYPHNNILTHLLYSGIVGVIFLMVFYYQTVKYYLKYYKYLKRWFLVFIITTMFVLTSGNTTFSLKLYLLEMILPFIFDYIYQRTNSLKRESNERDSINSIK